MPIQINVEVMIAIRKIKGKNLAADVEIIELNLSLLRTRKIKGVRFSTLEKICETLDSQPGNILSYESDIKQDN